MSKIIVRDGESIDSAIRRFKISCSKAGTMEEIRKREYYKSPSQKRKEKDEVARRRKYKYTGGTDYDTGYKL